MMKKAKIFFDHEELSLNKAIEIMSYSSYSFGVFPFTTALLTKKGVFLGKEHIKRLKKAIELYFSSNDLSDGLAQSKKLSIKFHSEKVQKLLVSQEKNQGDLLRYKIGLIEMEDGLHCLEFFSELDECKVDKAFISKSLFNSHQKNVKLKELNYQNYYNGLDQMKLNTLLVNENEEILESCFGQIIFKYKNNDQLFYSSLSQVDSISLNMLQENISLKPGILHLSNFLEKNQQTVESLWIINALRGPLPVAQLEFLNHKECSRNYFLELKVNSKDDDLLIRYWKDLLSDQKYYYSYEDFIKRLSYE